jgi:tRNA U34 5-carboxymethylaminomethyl modifying enzyme MnmG/GidA
MELEEKYDVIVVGAGHAGCEAAHCAATLGSKVLIISQNLETIARMSCNVHSYTNDQNLLDNMHKKPRRGRSAR